MNRLVCLIGFGMLLCLGLGAQVERGGLGEKSVVQQQLNFSCLSPEISELNLSEVLNPDNSATSPADVEFYMCNQSPNASEIKFNITLSYGEYSDPELMWEVVNNDEVEVGKGNFVDQPVIFGIPSLSGYKFFLRVGADSNFDGNLNTNETQIEIAIYLLRVEILATAEERSFLPSVSNYTGIVEINIQIEPPLSQSGGAINCF